MMVGGYTNRELRVFVFRDMMCTKMEWKGRGMSTGWGMGLGVGGWGLERDVMITIVTDYRRGLLYARSWFVVIIRAALEAFSWIPLHVLIRVGCFERKVILGAFHAGGFLQTTTPL